MRIDDALSYLEFGDPCSSDFDVALNAVISALKAQEQKCRKCGEATSKAIQELQTKLKAQEPHIMTLEEWREWERKPLSQRDPVYYIDNKGFGSWIAPNDQLFIYATPELGYGILFVCWTSRPTDEQREATPWN